MTLQDVKKALCKCVKHLVFTINEERKEIVLRAAMNNENDIKRFIDDFSIATNSSYIIRHTVPNSKKFTCRRLYLCHHSNFGKPAPRMNKKGKSKNCYCLAKDGYRAVITINYDHNHTTQTMDAFSRLRPVQSTRQTFVEYFERGLNKNDAMKEHERIMHTSPSTLKAANAQSHPTERTVKYWYEEWRSEKYGPKDGPELIQKLRTLMAKYEPHGYTFAVSENPFAVIVITPIMRRAHNLSTSADIMFSDSSASCDIKSHSVTLLLTPTAAGAIPLGIIITKGQSTVDYKVGFELFKNTIGQNGFCGKGRPKIGMTDDSDAERIALGAVWPDIILLLCRFHICQAVWRWLSKNDNGVPVNQRATFYNDFNKILTASTVEEADRFYEKIKLSQNAEWIKYTSTYWEKKEAWCLAYRDETVRGHHTNNLAEISVRILKDEILNRFKAYNVVSFVEKICETGEEYYRSRLKKFSTNRDDRARLCFEKESKKAGYLKKEDIVSIDDIFLVPSETEAHLQYTVDPRAGFCSCSAGTHGRFCKHMAGVFQHTNGGIIFQNLPSITPEDRHEMAVLAFGVDAAGDVSLYQPLELPRGFENTLDCEPTVSEVVAMEPDISADVMMNLDAVENGAAVAAYEQGLKILKEKFETLGCSEKAAKKFLLTCQSISTATALESFCFSTKQQMVHRTNSRIKVQTASVARRKNIKALKRIKK